ncbi:MAG: hypothetical protein Kow0031_26590 [Anaerolineae bacterium]
MHALLWYNKHRRPLAAALRQALRDFQAAPHTRGRTAAVCQLNPQQLPLDTSTLHGLKLVANPQVPINHLRICAQNGEVNDC